MGVCDGTVQLGGTPPADPCRCFRAQRHLRPGPHPPGNAGDFPFDGVQISMKALANVITLKASSRGTRVVFTAGTKLSNVDLTSRQGIARTVILAAFMHVHCN